MWGTSAEPNSPLYSQLTFKNFASVMFWGCIGRNGVCRLVVCKHRMDNKSYIDILPNNFPHSVEIMFGDEGEHFSFQQDNAPPHRARITIDFLKDQVIDVLLLPAQSPGLNIIDNFWLYLKNKLNFDSHGAPRTKDELFV